MINETLQKLQSESFTKEEILRDLIDEDLESNIKARMATGEEYYDNDPDILDTDFREYYVEGVKYTDENKANTHVTNNFHKLLVDQKASYIVGNAVTLDAKNKGLADEQEDKNLERISDILGENFEDTLNDYIVGASNKAWETLFVYIDEQGQFKYEIVPSQQIIIIYDTNHEKKINQVIRYYEVQVINKQSKEPETRYAAEWWTDTDVTYYLQNEQEEFELDVNYDPNPAPHFYKGNTALEGKTGISWGRVPFIVLENNSRRKTDLEPIKRYIDAYDAVTSGFLNDIDDIQTAIWILKGYEGTDLGEFLRNLKQFKAMKIAAEEHAGAEPERLEIPTEARKVMLDLLDNKIYSIGQGVDLNKLVSNTSGVALKILFTGLDMKANTLIRKLKGCLQNLLWFICQYIKLVDKKDVDPVDYGFVINKSVIYNIQELCQNLVMVAPFMSLETAVANNPYVDDAKSEIEQMKKEKQTELDAYGGSVRNQNEDEEEEGEDDEETSETEEG